MCIAQRQTSSAATVIAANDNGDARRSADAESRLRRARRGAAADILTSARGIPSTRKLGVPA